MQTKIQPKEEATSVSTDTTTSSQAASADFSELSLARAAAWANGHETGPVVFAHNYTSACLRDGRLAPFHLAPTPWLDFPMSYLAAANAAPGDMVVSLRLQPGMKEYLTEQGLLSPETTVVEVDPEMGSDGKLAFPATDALTLALGQGVTFPEGAKLAVTFPTNLNALQAMALGLEPVQSSDAFLTSNKALLRENSEKYGFTMSPGLLVKTFEELSEAAQAFAQSPKVWMKLAHGAGGDNVVPISGPITESKLIAGRERLYKAAEAAFEQGNFGSEALEHYWPKGSASPAESSIVIEEDASVCGKIIANLSNSVLVPKEGPARILQYYQQIIGPEGEFLGSTPVELDEKTLACLEPDMMKVAEMCRDMELYGLVGIDAFLVEKADGSKHPVIIELNGRPSSSANSHLIAAKLGAEHWINTDLRSAEPMNCIEDLEQKLSSCPEDYLNASIESGKVIALSFSSMYAENPEEPGKLELVRPSNKVRILIASSLGQERCLEILSHLKDAGFE